MTKPLSFLIFASLLFLLSLSVPTAIADRGMISVNPGVSIYEPGQKAIIAWNGKEEIMILSTDVHATNSTFVLEIMPLPSNPRKIERASFESFVRLQEFIVAHVQSLFGRGWYEQSGGQMKSVQVTFHEKIGAHDITVVNASDPSEFVAWMEDFLELNNIGQEVSLNEFEFVIADYMARGFQYFVLDLIGMSIEKNSVEPILYQFETNFIYYPLRISSPISGDTKITLFVLTNNAWSHYTLWSLDIPPFIPIPSRTPFSYYWKCYPLRIAFYEVNYAVAPIHFNLTNGELCTIDLRIGELFEGGAWLTVLEYEGALSSLTTDLMTTEGTGITATNAGLEGNLPYAVLDWSSGVVCALVGALVGTTLTLLIIRIKQPKEKMRHIMN